MSQVSIREYNAKQMWATFSDSSYSGKFVASPEQLAGIVDELRSLPNDRFVVKPDQLFGKRGKHGLIGVNLDAEAVYQRIKKRFDTSVTIDGVTDQLHSFLIEPYVEHDKEYFLSITTDRDADVLSFSTQGGVDIEDHRESTHILRLGVLDNLEDLQLADLTKGVEGQDTEVLHAFVRQFVDFFRERGFASLEVNPFVVTQGAVQCLDMVARVDSCESGKQARFWRPIQWVSPFGTHRSKVELDVAALDEKTGASLKLQVLNPDGRLWLILGGGGASVIVMDSLALRGYTDEIGNYGELSGNPDRDANREYATILIGTMLASKAENKHLLIVGGISNFTLIDKLFAGIVDAIRVHHVAMKLQGIRVLVRRGGVNDQRGLAMIRECCEGYGIPIVTMDGERYLTDVFEEIR